MSIRDNVIEVKGRIARACERVGRSPDGVTLVAVTKTVDVSAVLAAFEAGVSHFGENRVQEAEGKFPRLRDLAPRPTCHMVGHLQTNKAKNAIELFDIIQSVDSVRLADVLSRKAEGPIGIFLQVNVAGERTKGGISVDDIWRVLPEIQRLPNLDIRGLMTIAPLVGNPEEVRPVFSRLRELGHAAGLPDLSMGMTDDFEVAIEEGATVVRIGRAIFGERRGQP